MATLPAVTAAYDPLNSAPVLIVGAGPAGLALSVALAQADIGSVVLEQASADSLADPPEDGRDIALTHRARRVLESLGIWQRLPADQIAPLRRAEVRSGASPFVLPFDATGDGHEALGWLVPNHLIRAACHAQARCIPEVEIVAGAQVVALARDDTRATLTLADGRRWAAPLVVAADSRFSSLRRMAGIGAGMLDFGRTAIVARMRHSLAHDGTAHECFAHGHTLAMLPMAGQQSSAVLTLTGDQAAGWMADTPEGFARRVAELFDHRLGEMQLAGERHAYPLVATYARQFCGPRFALVGDAAVGMHPVTAHGYNFGLYGVEVLAHELAGARRAGRDVGDDGALTRYADAHRRTTLPIYLGTNAIVRLFTDDRPPARLLRGAVLRVASRLPPLKAAVTRQLTGDAGSLPRAH